MLVDSKKLGTGAELSEAEKMQRERARIGSLTGIVSYYWAPDGQAHPGAARRRHLPRRPRRQRPPADRDQGRPSSTRRSARRGRFVSFVRDNDLYVLDVATGAERKVADSTKDTVSWGLAEFIAQEEMGRRRGHWWAPNDSRIAVARVDESGVEVATRASIGADKTTTFEQRYPRAGTANAIVDLYLMNPDGTGTGEGRPRQEPRRLSRPGRLAARQQRRPRPAREPRPEDARRASRRCQDRRVEAAVQRHVGHVDQPVGRPPPAQGREHHLLVGAVGLPPPLPLGRRAHRAADAAAIGRSARLAGIDEANGRLYFTANRDKSIEYHLYALELPAAGRAAAAADPPGHAEQRGDGRDRRGWRSSPPAIPASRRRSGSPTGRASASPGSRRTGSTPAIPTRLTRRPR